MVTGQGDEAMDIILKAQERREQLKAELARLETFLATAYELEQELSGKPASLKTATPAEKADAPARRRVMARSGTGAETVRAVVEILADRGQPMATRELLPLVLARGIEVGGKDAVATLSARISKKGAVELVNGKWWLIQSDTESSSATADDNEEAADIPAKETSAASFFHNEGGTHGTALVN